MVRFCRKFKTSPNLTKRDLLAQFVMMECKKEGKKESKKEHKKGHRKERQRKKSRKKGARDLGGFLGRV